MKKKIKYNLHAPHRIDSKIATEICQEQILKEQIYRFFFTMTTRFIVDG